MALLKHYKNHTKLAVPESKELASEDTFGVAVIFFELRLQSLAICDFEVAAIRVTKYGPPNRAPYRRGGPIAVEGLRGPLRAYTAVDFRSESANRSENRIAKVVLRCTSHCTNRLFRSHLGP